MVKKTFETVCELGGNETSRLLFDRSYSKNMNCSFQLSLEHKSVVLFSSTLGTGSPNISIVQLLNGLCHTQSCLEHLNTKNRFLKYNG